MVAMSAATHDQPRVGARNLVVFNSVGRESTIHHVAHTLATHFSDPTEWQCVAMVWGGHAALKMALRATGLHQAAPLACVLHVSTGARWGDSLHLLVSLVVEPYAHVAVLLDDLFAPGSGPFAINVPRLLETMHLHQLGGISPAIFGAHAKPMLRLTGDKRTRACVRHVDAIEIFFSIYTREAWRCMAETLFDARNVGGCAYDICFEKTCRRFTLAIDDRSAAYHLERARPERWVVRQLAERDRESLLRLAQTGEPRAPRVDHTNNPCADSDIQKIADRHGCNYTSVFIDYDLPPLERRLDCSERALVRSLRSTNRRPSSL